MWPRHEARERRALKALYRNVTARDFSLDVLEVSSEDLSVLPAPECGWHDLGTPARMARYLGQPGGQLRKGA